MPISAGCPVQGDRRHEFGGKLHMQIVASYPLWGAVSMGVVTRGGSLRSLTPGYILHTPTACERSPEGCREISPGLSEAIPGVLSLLCLSHPGGVRGRCVSPS